MTGRWWRPTRSDPFVDRTPSPPTPLQGRGEEERLEGAVALWLRDPGNPVPPSLKGESPAARERQALTAYQGLGGMALSQRIGSISTPHLILEWRA